MEVTLTLREAIWLQQHLSLGIKAGWARTRLVLPDADATAVPAEGLRAMTVSKVKE